MFTATAWRCASNLASRALGGAGFVATAAAIASEPSKQAFLESKNGNYWEHDANEFDVYVRNATSEDLPKLLQAFQSGKEVWPWIWTQPNDNGPHHVFVGINRSVMEEIRTLLSQKDTNVNVLIIVEDDSQLKGIPSHLLDHCGIVSGAKVSLLNAEHNMLMLDDERVISFDRLTIV